MHNNWKSAINPPFKCVTLHNLFSFSKYSNQEPSRQCFIDLTRKLRGIQIIVIEEYSMLDSNLLILADKYLKKAKNNSLLFGGVGMLFVGTSANSHLLTHYLFLNFPIIFEYNWPLNLVAQSHFVLQVEKL